jgi:5-methylthioadenosine/S-adenosylhomocysteine deaminase
MGTVLRGLRSVERSAGSTNVRFEDRAVSVVTEAEIPSHPEDSVIDCAGKIALSGFVNAHTHLAMTLFRGLADDVPLHEWLEKHIWPIEAKMQPEDVYWCTLLGIAEGLRSGAVAFADMYFHTDEVARAVEESGVRSLLSYGMIAPTLEQKGNSELSTARALVERWEGTADGRIRTAVSPHTLYTCGEDVWRAAVELAADLGVPIHTHVSETRRETEAWRAEKGESPVASLQRYGACRVPLLAAHCVHVDEDDIAVLAECDVSVAHCPKSNAKLGSGIAPVVAMRNAGVNVAVGTDGAASNNRLDMMEEMRAVWLLQRASNEDAMTPSAADVVQMATEAGRRALGLAPGGLTVGGSADLVLLDADRLHATPPHDPTATLAYAADGLDVTDVIVDGRWLMKDGDLLTIDEEKVKAEVTRLLRRHNKS